MWARAGGVYVYVGVHPGLCVYVYVFVYMCRTAYVRMPTHMRLGVVGICVLAFAVVLA